MLTPLRSEGSDEEVPPKRSELESKPLPVPFGASGVGREAFGVGAVDEDDFEGALISGTCCFGSSHVGRSTSIAPSILETAGIALLGGGDTCAGAAAKEVEEGRGGGDDICCGGTKGCLTIVCGEYGVAFADVLEAFGGSIRLAIDGDADARLTYEDACAGCVPLEALAGRGGGASMVEPRIGS